MLSLINVIFSSSNSKFRMDNARGFISDIFSGRFFSAIDLIHLIDGSESGC